MDPKKDFTVERLPGSLAKIRGELSYAELEKERARAVRELGRRIRVDGFRAGRAPEAIIVRQVGEAAILANAAERALAAAYPKILAAHELDAIGEPKTEIESLAPGQPFRFTITAAIMPAIELPDYAKIARELNKEKGEATITDDEVERQIKDILRQKAAYERLQQKAAAGIQETHTHADGSVHEGPAHDESGQSLPDPDLVIPELTDEVARSLGQPGQFADAADLKAKLREHLSIEKTREEAAKHRAALTDSVIAGSRFELPQVLIDAEIRQMFAQMEEDIKRAGLKVEDYFAHMKKTREDLQREWAPAADKRARLQLVLNEIAKQEDIKPDPTEVAAETKRLLEQYKDADAGRVAVYVASVLQNEAVMKFLESR